VELLESGTVQRRYHRFDNRRRLTNTDEDFALTNALSTGYYQSDHATDIGNIATDAASASIKYDFQLDKADARALVTRTGSPNRAYTHGAGHRIATAGVDTLTHYTDGTRASDGANRYEVDALGRILRVSDPTGAVTRNALGYDPLGRVASITDAGGTRSDLSYFGAEVWQESVSGAATRQYSRHGWTPGPTAVHVSGASYLPLFDARMNLLAVTDSSGTVLDRCRYEPFGTPSSTALPTSGLEPVFGGMRYLDGSGLYLAGLRLMDPVEGAWLSQDPAAYVDSPDLYCYAGANPIDHVDPHGAQYNVSGGFHPMPESTNPQGRTIGLPSKADWKVQEVVHRGDAVWNTLGDVYGATKYAAPGIYFGGYAASGALIGGFEVARDPWQFGVVKPVGGIWTLAKASSPVYMAFAPKEAMESQNSIGLGIVNSVTHPEEGAFEFGRGTSHNVFVTLATEGAGSMLRGGSVAEVGAQSSIVSAEQRVLFGQRRLGESFSRQPGVPDYLYGRLVSDVAADLRAGILSPDQLPINAFVHSSGELVSINTRTLAALSEAGMQPTIINIVTPKLSVLSRLSETPIIDSPLPGPSIPVTPSMTDLTVIRVIHIP
jgi:RHS repeat-associated protein